MDEVFKISTFQQGQMRELIERLKESGVVVAEQDNYGVSYLISHSMMMHMINFWLRSILGLELTQKDGMTKAIKTQSTTLGNLSKTDMQDSIIDFFKYNLEGVSQEQNAYALAMQLVDLLYTVDKEDNPTRLKLVELKTKN